MEKEHLLKSVARKILTQEETKLIEKGFDKIGDICIIRIPQEIKEKKFEFADLLLQEVSPNIKVILEQTGPVHGEYRLRELKWLAGEKRTTTLYKENGCKLLVDLDKIYFSPRLSYERMRIAKLIQQSPKHENIVNMFAGVGSFSIIIAKYCKSVKIYSIDLNPEAINFMNKNIQINKISEKVIPILGDAKKIIEDNLQGIADRVLMPLPEKAYEYLDVAISSLRSKIGFIHYYDMIHAKKGEKPLNLVANRIDRRMKELRIDYDLSSSRIVRTVGPNWYQVVLDLKVLP